MFFGQEASIFQKACAEIFEIRENELERLKNLGEIANKEDKIIANYHKGYADILSALKAAHSDYPKLKALVAVLYAKYRELLALDKARFYEDFKKDYPLVLLAIMASYDLRNYLKFETKTVYNDVMPKLDMDIKTIANTLQSKGIGSVPAAVYINSPEALEKFKFEHKGQKLHKIKKSGGNYVILQDQGAEIFELGEYYLPAVAVSHVKKFSGKTDEYWKDLEPKGKKFMIISIAEGNKVRGAGDSGTELDASQINGQFVFTDGVDYKSNSDSDELYYMEV